MRRARQQRGLTLRQLAARAGTSHSTLAAYESNAKVPRADTMLRVLEAAGWNVEVTSVDDLGWTERVERGEELAAVLELAAQFPTRHDPDLRAPRFAMVG
jgi:transcriptional regulator with XRE-family HTH domain